MEKAMEKAMVMAAPTARLFGQKSHFDELRRRCSATKMHKKHKLF
jgi:hypothetical protein